MLAATVGKIAHEVISLQMTELEEVEEPFNEGKVGSSTMPHKRNPMLCEAILGLTQLIIQTVPTALQAMMQEHERNWARQHMEWAFIPEACCMSDGALSPDYTHTMGLRVNPANMARNLDHLDGLMQSEAVMLELARACRTSDGARCGLCVLDARGGAKSFFSFDFGRRSDGEQTFINVRD